MAISPLSKPGSSGHGVYYRWFMPTMGLGLLGLATVFLTSQAVAPRPATSQGLIIDPPSVKFDDQIFQEGEYVEAKFRITNPLSQPVAIKALRTSCACMAYVPQGGRAPPFVLKSGETIEFALKTLTQAGSQLEQTYEAYVESECDGRRLPDVRVTMTLRVEDILKPSLREIMVLDAPTGSPVHRKIVLYTKSGNSEVAEPTLRVSDLQSIRVALTPISSSRLDELRDGYRSRYELDVTILSTSGNSAIIGNIEVEEKGRTLLRIPVHCEFTPNYWLSQNRLDIEGPPGAVITRELFYEWSSPDWQLRRVVSHLEDIDIEIEPFDATTQVIRLTLPIPECPSPDDQVLVLAVGDRGSEIEVPIRVTPLVE